MARIYGILGPIRGKLGNSVFAVVNGTQVIRQYQSGVANPKSEGQRLQRAKGNLVGQISKVTPWQILTGLGNNKRSRRNRFLRLCLNGVTANFDQTDPSIVLAKLDAPNFKFSEGAFLPTITASAANAATYSVNVTLSRLPGASDADFLASGALVVVTILSVSGKYESVLYRFVDSSEFEGTTLNIAFSHIQEGAYFAEVYIAPFATEDGSSLRAKAQSLYGDGVDFAARMVYNPSALPLVWGNSEAIMEASFTPAP